MFTPATRKSRSIHQKDRKPGHGPPDSPATPVAGSFSVASAHHRPATGTPAPWASCLSVLARIPSSKNEEKGSDADQIQPVFVGEVPQIVRKAQAESVIKKVAAGSAGFSGGMDKITSLAWIICENRIFIWSYLSSALPSNCIVLDFPSSVLALRDFNLGGYSNNHWLVCIIKRNKTDIRKDKVISPCDSAGVVICHRKTQVIVFWPDIFSESGCVPIVSLQRTEELKGSFLPGVKDGSEDLLNSMISASIPHSSTEAVALACHSSGELWCFYCTTVGISRKRVSDSFSAVQSTSDVGSQLSKFYAKSLVWRFKCSEESCQQFFLLVDHEIQCWNIILSADPEVTKQWSHKIVGADSDLGIKKDLAGQKHIWLLDMQVDDRGKELTLLVATFCKDRISSSSYRMYHLLTMQYKSDRYISTENYSTERVLERKFPLEVIIPKARIDDENVLLSMRLRVGGKPHGSTIILSGDGTATVANHSRGSTKLYKFDLPYDAGKILDATVSPTPEDGEDGAWVVLTEKAGLWAIPEKSVLLGGVEPPEKSLSRNGRPIGVLEEENRSKVFGSIHSPKWVGSPPDSNSGGKLAFLEPVTQRNLQDEESEVTLGRLFHEFLLSGEVEGALEKLRNSGAFGKESETNVFARMSKSIVDTLAKHWIASRGAEFAGSTATVSQLLDKKQKHERYLQFLALSKCHEELSFNQSHALQIIVEHGEKLYGMIQIRELQNQLSQSQPSEKDSPSFHTSKEAAGSLWDLIQLVGEKARRHTVLLMDRDNAEVFYSKVSELENLFSCLSHHIKYVVSEDQHFEIQMKRAYEVSNACITVVQAALHYRREHQTWYPSQEGLYSWNCQPVVRTGLWSIASAIMQLLKDGSLTPLSTKSGLCSQLEGLTDVLLESYTSSVTVKNERGEEPKALLQEYHDRRDVLLDSLYQQARDFTELQYMETCKNTDDAKLKETIFRELSLPLLAIAKRHEGYQTLWNICYDLHDVGLVRSLMHDSVGPLGGFSYFVFKELYERNQHSKLLRLGEEFQEELVRFLKQQKDLLWLHEVFLNKFSSASDTLHALALSVDNDGSSCTKIKQANKGTSLAERKLFLNLAKISALTGKAAGFELKVMQMDADLQILKLQEEIVKLLPNGKDDVTSKLLHSRDLIEMCLKGNSRLLSLLAFEVFTRTGPSFRSANRSLLESCWRNAADQDDWLSLHHDSLNDGWSDEATAHYLSETVLFKASNICYGPETDAYEGSFDQVLALQKEDLQLSTLMGAVSSVEEILMQHKDFPDAGKLMRTAVVMGKMGYEVEEDTVMETQ